MSLKTNERENGNVSDGYYIVEKKLLRRMVRQIQSIGMNIQEITEKYTADGRQITDFSSAKCEKMRLKHEFSCRPAAMRVCDACGIFSSRPAPSRVHSPAPCPSTAVWAARTFILVYPPFPGDVNCPISRWVGWRDHWAPEVATRGLGPRHQTPRPRHPRIQSRVSR